MMSDYGSVDGLGARLDGAVLRLELDRPDKRNAIDDVMMGGLIDAVDRAGRDEAVRVIVLGGAGDHFCAGADIVARNAAGPDRGTSERPRVGSIQRRVPSLAHRLIPLVIHVQTPVVCRVQGWAAGIGFQLALASDFTVAATDARFWEPFTERGFTPDSGATWLLPADRRPGPGPRAVVARPLARRRRGGRVGDRPPRRGPRSDSTTRWTSSSSDWPPARRWRSGLTKWLLGAGQTEPLEAQLHNEALALELSSRSEDFREGLQAFGEKRPPEFRGR